MSVEPPDADADTADAADGEAGAPAGLAPESRLGRFVVRAPIGAGGMGEVYRAHDPELHRDVAVKVLRAGRLGPLRAEEMRTRLQREAQAMARLSHPCVVTIFEVGRLDEQIFLVMELVEGSNLREWLAAAPRGWREVVRVLREAGSGLAAAHAAGLIHRDFKPENIFVGTDGRVRVGDFGLVGRGRGDPVSSPNVDLDTAMAADVTHTGVHLGTPRYMAPELFGNQPASERSDQFAFCVTLYEALFGKQPFAGHTMRELLRNLAAGVPREAPNDRRVPGWLLRAVQRGLSPDPAARHPSMSLLLAVLGRPSRAPRYPLAAAVAVAVAGVAAAFVMWHRGAAPCSGAAGRLATVWGKERRNAIAAALAGTGVPYAEATTTSTLAALDHYATAWKAARTEACVATSRGEQSSELLDLRMACLDRRLAELDAAAALLAAADRDVAASAVELASELPALSFCADTEILRGQVEPPHDPAVAAEVASLRTELARGDAERRAARARAALARVEPLLPRARETGYDPVIAECLVLLGDLYGDVADRDRAFSYLKEGYLLASGARHDEVAAHAASMLAATYAALVKDAASATTWAEYADAALRRLGDHVELERSALLSTRGNIDMLQGDYAKAREHYQAALELAERAGGPEHPRALSALNDLIAVYYRQGKLGEATEVAERALSRARHALGSQHPLVSSALNNLGMILDEEDRNEEAVAAYREAIEIDAATIGPDHPDTAPTLVNLGVTLDKLHRYDEAIAYQTRALGLREKLVGPDHVSMAAYHNALGSSYYEAGRRDEAVVEFTRSLAIREASLGPDHPDLAPSLVNVGSVEYERGHFKEAAALFRRSLAIREKALGPDHPDVAQSLVNLAGALVGEGDRAGAVPLYLRAIAIREKARGAAHPSLASPLLELGDAYLGLDRPRDAIAPLERALPLVAQAAPQDRAHARVLLARALWQSRRDDARVEALVAEARAEIAEAGPEGAKTRAEIDGWLAKRAR